MSILIGRNGSGKTTFMDMLQAVLRVDLEQLYDLDFKEIIIKLKDGKARRKISVTKESLSNRTYELTKFKVGTKSFNIPLHPIELDKYRYQVRHIKSSSDYLELKRNIESLVNVASLSVHRISPDKFNEDEGPRSSKFSHKPMVDRRIEQLNNELTAYQLSLAEREKEVSAKFQNDVLASMLYDSNFDVIDLTEASRTELGKEKAQLTKAYQDLGAFDSSINQRINKHFSQLSQSLTNISGHGLM